MFSRLSFAEKLAFNFEGGRTACAGLDPLRGKIPAHLLRKHRDWIEAWREYLYQLVMIAAPHVAAFKPNLGFFLRRGSRGVALLEDLFRLMRDCAPNALLILDAKFGDIGDTNNCYDGFAFHHDDEPIAGAEADNDLARIYEAFTGLNADAVTIHNYLGPEAMRPFLDDPRRGAIILCRTSNPGAGHYQDLIVQESGLPLYLHIARDVVSGAWGTYPNRALVVGATSPTQLTEICEVTDDCPLLLPGVSKKQGGLIEDVIAAILKSKKVRPFLLNRSSDFLQASSGEDFALAGEKVLIDTNEQIRLLLKG